MNEDDRPTTVLIGGHHDGQSIECTIPPILSLVMLAGDGFESEGYALRTFIEEQERRLFYVLDGMPREEANQKARERWTHGLKDHRSDS